MIHLDNETLIRVKNSLNSESDPPKGYDSWLEWFFNGNIPSSMTCPSCKRLMIRPNSRQNWRNHPYMIGGHVESTPISILYITSICNECNNQKDKLPPFNVKLGNLKPMFNK